jgi:membrane-associated phospholipid phosphatase
MTSPETSKHLDGDGGRNGWLAELTRLDTAVYDAIATTPTPGLDRTMRRVSDAANYSRLSIASAALLALGGGRRGRRAAVGGLAAVSATSAVVNLVVKPLGRRRRPDRAALDVPVQRQVAMPRSRSFPSGHTAAAIAFADGASFELPAAGLPLHLLAAVVGYSRIHTGVHFPGDVVAGAVIGSAVADVTSSVIMGLRQRSSGDSGRSRGQARA